jgi:hypothetical protein
MKEIKDLITKSLYSSRNLGELDFNRFSDLSSLEKIGLEFGIEHLKKILENKELTQTAISPMVQPPDWIYDFIVSLTDNITSKRILDPFIGINSFLVRNVQKNFKGYCINKQERRLIVEGFQIDESKILLGEPLELFTQENEKSDLVISFPPFGIRARTSESISKDYATDLLITSSKHIKENGKLIFLMPGKFVFDKKIEKSLKEFDLFVNALFYLPEGSHSNTSISSYLVIVSKSATQKTFIAQLSSSTIHNKVIANNFNKHKEGKTTSLGSFIEFDNFTSYKALEKSDDISKIGRKTGLTPTNLKNIATLKTIGNKSTEEIEHSNNMIYLPRIGNSDVVENPSNFNIKPQNYIQLILGNQISPTYLVKYLNTSLGKLTRESRMVGATIQNITLSSLEDAPLFIPSYQEQISLIEVNNKIENLLLEISEYQNQLWKRPNQTKEINKSIVQYEKDNSIEKWLDSLPFPISSILWKYIATSENKSKIDYLLHFFEAFSEFLSMLLLSAFYQDKQFYKSESHRWINNDSQYDDWIKKATFGGWNNLTANLLKASRTLINDPDKKDIIFNLLGKPSSEFLNFITSKKIIPVLENVREYRNDWKGHGGVSSEQDNINRLTLLEQELNSLRQVIQGAFDDCRLISATTGNYKNGVHNYKAKELVGSKTPFNEIKVTSLKALDENKLYLVHQNHNEPIELLPFIKFNQESKACYFYNSIQTTNIRWVSFHFEQNSELMEAVDEKFEEILNILKQQSD